MDSSKPPGLGMQKWMLSFSRLLSLDANMIQMYFQKHDGIFQVIILYVDDLFIIGICNTQIGSIKASLHSEFAMIDLGLLRQFLGLEIEQYERGIILSQPKYASDLINNFNMAYCKAYKCPFLSGIKLGEFGNSPLVDCTLYKKLVGSLIYITHTQNDYLMF